MCSVYTCHIIIAVIDFVFKSTSDKHCYLTLLIFSLAVSQHEHFSLENVALIIMSDVINTVQSLHEHCSQELTLFITCFKSCL